MPLLNFSLERYLLRFIRIIKDNTINYLLLELFFLTRKDLGCTNERSREHRSCMNWNDAGARSFGRGIDICSVLDFGGHVKRKESRVFSVYHWSVWKRKRRHQTHLFPSEPTKPPFILSRTCFTSFSTLSLYFFRLNLKEIIFQYALYICVDRK